MQRIMTGIADLDRILDGGLPRGSLNVIAGAPGTGKTILAQQVVYANAQPNAPALYLTTLSEPSAKVLRYLQTFTFFDDAKLLDTPAVVYRDIAEVIRGEGFQALSKILVGLLDEHQPSILVIDSFKALRDLGASPAELRRSLFDLAGNLAARPCTTLLVGEYTPQEELELPEFAIADGIVHLANRPSGMRDERYLRIVKLRGSSYRSGEHAFRITGHGIAVFPRLVSPREPVAYTASAERVSTGVAGLDRMLEGGVRRGSSTLIVGSSGTGKTLLGLHFLFAGIAAGEHGLLVSFQENPTLMQQIVTGRGWNAQELAEQGRLTPLYVSPVEMNIDDIVRRVLVALDTQPIKRVVIDSIGDLQMASSDPQRFHSYVYALGQLLAVRGVTTFLTSESRVDQFYGTIAHDGISYLSDNVIGIRYAVENGRGGTDSLLGRTVGVLKTRGSAHDPHIRRLTIHAHSVEVGGSPRR